MSRCAPKLFLLLLTAIWFVASSLPAAAWTPDGTVVCAAPESQFEPIMVSDGSGGAIVAWADPRNGDYDIYVQLVDSAGNAMWSADGVALCTASNNQLSPSIASDGAGGAVVVWHDQRSDTSKIYVQRISAAGTVQWIADGVALCAAAGTQGGQKITSDGFGGAIVAWVDNRSGNTDVYAQRIDSSGTSQWTTDGVALCTDVGYQGGPEIISDGSGGAIVTWPDFRGGSNYDIYARRVDSSGAVQWTADGVALCTAALDQIYPKITSDGSGGAIVTWQDSRSGVSNRNIFAQCVDATGAVQWTANGIALCAATGSQTGPEIVSDGSGGAIVAWDDYRSGDGDIFAQRVDLTGLVLWTTNGVPVCTATRTQRYVTLVSDSGGGTILVWHDERRMVDYWDIYAQRISASGTAQWAANGVAVCVPPDYVTLDDHSVTSDGSGGAITVWRDFRNNPGTRGDIFAQRVTQLGNIGEDPDPLPFSMLTIIVIGATLGSFGLRRL